MTPWLRSYRGSHSVAIDNGIETKFPFDHVWVERDSVLEVDIPNVLIGIYLAKLITSALAGPTQRR
jgi:hypothetical protein